MLTRIHDWNAFSNHTVGDGGSTSNSLEAIHDGIHGDVGGGGQMSDPGVAGDLQVLCFIYPLLIRLTSFRSHLLLAPLQRR